MAVGTIDRSLQMTSRQRVQRALRRQEPDRVPVDYCSNPAIHARLKAHFRLPANDEEGLLCALGIDFRGATPPYVGKRLHAEVAERLVNPEWGFHLRWIEHSSGGYWDFCDFPLREASNEELDRWPMPTAEDYDYAAVKRACAAHPDKAIYLGHPGLADIMNSTGMIRSVEQTMMDLAVEEEAVLRLIDRRLDVQYEMMKRSLEAAEGRIDFLWIGEDLGSQRGPLISREMFQKLIAPRHRRFIELGKQYRIPVMLHSCGSSSWAYDDFIKMGVDAVDTLQPEALNMSPRCLKEKFGDRLAFHGCISTAGAVAHGTVEDMVRTVRETLEIMMPGGGYCLAPTHALQDNSPTQNVVAMYEAARKYGKYS